MTQFNDMYIKDLYYPGIDVTKIKEVVDTYHTNVQDGSPFRTGLLNERYPGYKRLAAWLGDMLMNLRRRLTLEDYAQSFPDVPSWSYLSSYGYGTPLLGTFHASDLFQTFYGVPPNYASISTRTYYFNFLYNLDPNKGVKLGAERHWPTWAEGKMLMWFKNAISTSLIKDDYREKSAAVYRKYIKDFLI